MRLSLKYDINVRIKKKKKNKFQGSENIKKKESKSCIEFPSPRLKQRVKTLDPG